MRLSDDNGKGSELAEILLYGIMKRHYGTLSVVPKIYYKQNARDNAKGADSVHIVLEDDKFSLWYGESKFYSDLEGAMRAALSSVKDTISDSKLRKENSIVTSLKDLEVLIQNENQLEEIRSMLSPNTSLDALKPILHIPILLLYECDITSKQDRWNSAYSSQICSLYQEKAGAFFQRLNGACSEIFCYEEITFHLILFPIPNKEDVVNRFVERAKYLKQ